jgi:glucuronoxylan 4-O-methyltransferase
MMFLEVISRVFWISGLPRFLDLLRRTVFRPILYMCTLKPGLIRMILMKIAYNICMRPSEILCIARAIELKRPCRLLVFGLGNDSMFWSMLNRYGKTIFLEDHAKWFNRVTYLNPSINAFLIEYNTVLIEWHELLNHPKYLRMDFPENIMKESWDIILVDGPVGWNNAAPGRMKSIFAAGNLRTTSTDVFVHDCNRKIEQVYSDRYLGENNLVRQVGKLRQYRFSDSLCHPISSDSAENSNLMIKSCSDIPVTAV